MKKKSCWYSSGCNPASKNGNAIGFILLVFGVVTICAFFLPTKVWLIVLGILLIGTGVVLLRT